MLNSGNLKEIQDFTQKTGESVQLFALLNCVESLKGVEPLNVKIFLGTLKLVLWPLRLYTCDLGPWQIPNSLGGHLYPQTGWAACW